MFGLLSNGGKMLVCHSNAMMPLFFLVFRNERRTTDGEMVQVLTRQVDTLNSQLSSIKQELDVANHRLERLVKVDEWFKLNLNMYPPMKYTYF